ncbi:hypothetical protein ACFQ9V_00575 [Leifsonia sp. NPDC056665]|uniref:hypothetical protein n=1 Tax=Leifsonia sp. NPDC056665 TaxID=3345901 RepID=UPI0036A24769
MLDSTPNSKTISRRTIAKTAAWAAPAIALSAASPAFATSTENKVAMILFDEPTYDVPAPGIITITGTLVPITGQKVPADIKFDRTFPGATGWYASQPVVSGNTFTMTVQAYANATPGATLRMSSPNYSAYTPGTTTVNAIGAPVPVASGEINFDYSLYLLPRGGEVELSGVLVPADGTSVPADIALVADVASADYVVSEKPVVTGDTFTMKVTNASSTTMPIAVSVQSPNYPSYTAATTQLSLNAPGFIEAGYGMLPIANTWVASTSAATAGRDKAVRWFRPAASTPIIVTSGMLGKAWLDLRASLQNQSVFTDNFKTAPFQVPEYSGAFPDNFPNLAVRTEANVVSLTVNGVAQQVGHGIGLRLGGSTVSGPGAVGGSARPAVAFWPSHDSSGNATTNGNVYAFLPASLPKGSVGRVEIVTTVARPDGAATKIGFVVDYYYK